MRPTFALVVEEHQIDGVDDGRGSIVVTCRCGWRSAPGDDAEQACTQWDRHVATAVGVAQR